MTARQPAPPVQLRYGQLTCCESKLHCEPAYQIESFPILPNHLHITIRNQMASLADEYNNMLYLQSGRICSQQAFALATLEGSWPQVIDDCLHA